MKNLQVSFEGTTDTTGYLFSFAKCLSAVLRSSVYKEYADDIIASSGFAFRMWAAKDLCPSAMSIWEFKKQKDWVESGGLICEYAERLWGEEHVEEERRMEAIRMIKSSIDNGVATVAWDMGDCEWGIIKGYDDDKQTLYTLKIDGTEDCISYDKLGKCEIPILSVLAIKDKYEKDIKRVIADTKLVAAAHLRGEEWCENSQGIAAYETILNYIRDNTADMPWELEYYLGTYAALKWYAWRFFAKNNEDKCAAIYERIHKAWQSAFEIKCRKDVSEEDIRKEILVLLEEAKEAEAEFLDLLSK